VLCRWPSLFIPYVDIDEVLWGLTANAIVDGHPPYQAVMGEKPPLLYLSYAAIFSLFGKHNYFAMHVFGIIWMALTSFIIAHLVKRYASNKTAFFAGATYIFFGSASGFRMLATTGELMMNLFFILILRNINYFWHGWLFQHNGRQNVIEILICCL
jgi:4-amino-4-deoxy-L-arabinose transferase-like glycosyltransferase